MDEKTEYILKEAGEGGKREMTKHAALIITLQYRDRRSPAAPEVGASGCSVAVRTGRALQQRALRGNAAPLPPGPTCWIHAVAVPETQTWSCLPAALCPPA